MAVQIARIESGRLKVDIDVIGKILDKVGAHPVSVVTVSGPLQSGKSKITNRLLHSLVAQNAGDEGSSHQTQMSELVWKNSANQPNEILMWPEPLTASHTGRSTAVLLMSVHGNLDGTITSMENSLIFAFGCIFASVMIYHVKHGFSEDMLQFLQMTIASAKAVSEQDDCCPFSKLLFFINDWQFPGDYTYGYHEDHSLPYIRNFKKEKMNVLTGIVPEDRVVREEILCNFQEICCCLANKFGEDEKAEDMGPIKDLGNWIFREGHSINKTVHGKEVTGIELKVLVQQWARSMFTSRIPAVRMEVEAPGEVTIATALSVTLSFFKKEMTSAINGHVSLSRDQLRKTHARKEKEAVAMFERLTVTEPQDRTRRYVNMLQAEFDEYFGTLLLMNVENRPHPPPPLLGQVQFQMADAVQENILHQRRINRLWLFIVIFGLKIIVIIIIFSRYT